MAESEAKKPRRSYYPMGCDGLPHIVPPTPTQGVAGPIPAEGVQNCLSELTPDPECVALARRPHGTGGDDAVVTARTPFGTDSRRKLCRSDNPSPGCRTARHGR